MGKTNASVKSKANGTSKSKYKTSQTIKSTKSKITSEKSGAKLPTNNSEYFTDGSKGT
jgi:hypothetical protein